MITELRIAFVLQNIGVSENSSVPILSSLAKQQGHYIRLFDCAPDKEQTCNEIISWKPDIVAYSICSNEAASSLQFNNILKSKFAFFSVYGGPHVTYSPSFVEEDGVDAICRGEGDICFPAFLKHFGQNKMYEVSNFSFKKDGNGVIENPLAPLVSDLDDLPLPDRDLTYSQSYFLANNPIKSFFAGRGCPFKCTYCFNHVFNAMYKGKGKVLRTKSVTYLFNEIKTVANKYPLTFIKFHDDIFGADRRWLGEFAVRYPKEIGLPFLCYARPNIISEEYCRQLKKAGCYSVCLAIECGNEHIRNSILNRNVSNKQIISACKSLKKFGIRIYTLNMIGLPEESDNEIFQTIRLNQDVESEFADAFIFQPYPGTQITEYCKKNGYLDEGAESFGSQFSTSVLNFKQDFKDRIYVIHKLFPIMVDYPRAKTSLQFLFKLNKFRFIKNILNIIYKLYYGYNLHHRIYASKIPLRTNIYGAFLLLISKNRI